MFPYLGYQMTAKYNSFFRLIRPQKSKLTLPAVLKGRGAY
jgi:hypothetical protein